MPAIALQAAGPVLNLPAEPILAKLTTEPRTLYAGLHASLRFDLSDRQGRPISDLSPYLGAMGHCMIISEDSGTFLHSHPEDVRGVTPEWRGGPGVTFGTLFPKAGRYRIWGQFRRGEHMIIADFNVDVKDSLVPLGIIKFFFND